MKTNNLRNLILNALYEKRSSNPFSGKEFIISIMSKLPKVEQNSGDEIRAEVEFLKREGMLEIQNQFVGGPFSFYNIRLTSRGVNFVEDPDSFNNSVNINQISADNGSAVVVGSQNDVKINNGIDNKEVMKLVEKLIDSRKDQSKIKEILKIAVDKGLDFTIALFSAYITRVPQ